MKQKIFWGAGKICKHLLDYASLHKWDILYVIDNDREKWGTKIGGVSICSPQYLKSVKASDVEIIISASIYFFEPILSQLKSMGFEYGQHVFTYPDKLLDELYEEVTPVFQGETKMRKYFVKSKTGDNRFIKFSESGHSAVSYKKLYNIYSKLNNINQVVMCLSYVEPLEEAGFGFLEFEMIDSKQDLTVILAESTDDEQYELGVQAGETLLKIHNTPLDSTAKTFLPTLEKSLEYKRKFIRESGLGFTDVERMCIKHIDQNVELLGGSCTALLHGNYHAGNMLWGKSRCIKIIDFDEVCYGDPLFDFAFVSNMMATTFNLGVIHGYFSPNPTFEQWQKIRWYSYVAELFVVTYCHKINHPLFEIFRKHANVRIMDWFDGEGERVTPKWYTPYPQMQQL